VNYARDLLLAFASQRGGRQAALPGALLPDHLSAAELRVPGLPARGRSNPQIAATLVVSINTIKTHMQSIYRKLGVRNRWEASETAHRLDLL
jgi:LuxR family maltose regulon positive regulatory protein